MTAEFPKGAFPFVPSIKAFVAVTWSEVEQALKDGFEKIYYTGEELPEGYASALDFSVQNGVDVVHRNLSVEQKKVDTLGELKDVFRDKARHGDSHALIVTGPFDLSDYFEPDSMKEWVMMYARVCARYIQE